MNFECEYEEDLINLLEKEKDLCSECLNNDALEICENCDKLICRNDACSELFPGEKKEYFAVCMSCKKDIERRFKVLIDLEKLELQKKKIEIYNSNDE